MRDSKELLSLLQEAERLVPLEQLTVNDVAVWPILRVYAAFRLRDDHPRPVSRSILPYAFRKKIGSLKAKKPEMPLPSGKVDFLTIGQASHRTDNIDGKAFNRYTDPIHAFLSPKQGLHLEIDFDKHQNNYPYPTFHIADWLDWTRQKHPSYLKDFSNGLRTWCSAMQESHQDDYFHPEHVAYWIDLSFAAEKLALELFERNSPRVLLLASFYDPVMLGFIRAANQKKLPVVELQHGVQGEGHFGYSGWKSLPAECRKYLPSHFAHFTKAEAESLAARMPKGVTTHWVMGNSWMRYSRDELKLSSKSAKKNKGLVSLGISERLFDETMLHIMKDNQDVEWLVRMHPRSLERMQEVKEILQQNAVRSFEVEQSSKRPLYEVLSEIGFHVTKQSTVALEALDYRIKTVITSIEGERYFADEIAKGWMKYCSQPTEWNSISSWVLEKDEDMHYSEAPEMSWVDLLHHVKL